MDTSNLSFLLACEQLHRLPIALADQPGLSWTARLEEAQDKSRQLAMWVLCAHVARLFQCYPDTVETVEIRLEKQKDDDWNTVVNGQLWINGQHYNPGDDNEFDSDWMEAMEEIDGLLALNAAADGCAMAVPQGLIGHCDQIIEAFQEEVFANSSQAWTMAETLAPDIHPHAQALQLEMATPKARKPVPRKGRL